MNVLRCITMCVFLFTVTGCASKMELTQTGLLEIELQGIEGEKMEIIMEQLCKLIDYIH